MSKLLPALHQRRYFGEKMGVSMSTKRIETVTDLSEVNYFSWGKGPVARVSQ